MKKIGVFCSLIIAIAVIITCFAACGGNNDDVTTTEATTEEVIVTQVAVVEDVELTAIIEEDCVLIKKGDEVFQKLPYPVKKGLVIDFEYAKNNFKFLDMNFDGLADFYLAIGETDGNVQFLCWLYNATSKQYDYSISLSSLKNISVDADEQLIYSSDDGFYYEYGWVDGQLTVNSSYDKTEEVPEKVTQASNNLVADKNESTTAKVTNASDSTTINNNATTSNKADDNTQANDTVVTSTAASTEATTQKVQLNTTTTAPATKGTVEVYTETMPEMDWQ